MPDGIQSSLQPVDVVQDTSRQNANPISAPLCIELNRTLIYGDILWEAILLLVKRQPLLVLMLPFWWCLGRAVVVARIAQRIVIAPEGLSYRQNVLAFVRGQKRLGRRVVLITTAHKSFAHSIAECLGCFDDVMVCDGQAGRQVPLKLDAIRRYVGNTAFAYLGHDSKDLPIWQAACERVAVAPSRQVSAQLERMQPPLRVLDGHPNGGTLRGLLRAMRPSQWAKNLLLVVPLVMSHQISAGWLWGQLAVAFCAFSCCASSGYIINDLLDLEADRVHPHKRHRPFASGQVSIPLGIGVAFGLGLIGLLMAAVVLPLSLVQLLIVYLVLTFAYSLYCKRRLIMDAVVLAGLYTHRIVAGGVAVEVIPSPWLLTFSMFLFLSLAFAKRYAELLRLQTEGNRTTKGRGYEVDDLPMVGNLGATSGYIAVLVFILYLNNSPDVPLLYADVTGLWLISPILLYWISRVWMLVRRGILHEDPVLFTLSDRVSYVCGGLILLLIIVAANGWRLVL